MAAKISGRSLEQRLHAHGFPISSLQYGVLRLINHEQYTISELSRRMSLTPATLVPVVDALERHGYLARGRDPNDRRRTPLVLSESGAAVLARVPAVHDDDALVGGLETLGTDKRLQLRDLLRELLGAMPESQHAVGEVQRTLHLISDPSNLSDRA